MINDQDKTKEELNLELKQLQQEHNSLKAKYTKDITDRKRNEKELLEKEARLQEAQRIGQMGHWDLDLITNQLLWSDETYRIFGLKPQEFKATYEVFLDRIHPDDREKVNNAYINSLKTKKPYRIEHRLLLLKTGELKYVAEQCKTEFDKHGKPLRSIGTVQDITKHKKAEEELRLAKEKAEENEAKYKLLSTLSFEGIIIHDKGVVIDVNQTFLDMTGTSYKELIGKNILENFTIPEKFHPIIYNSMAKKNSSPFEIEAIIKDGSIVPVEIEAKEIEGTNDRTTRAVAIRDITRRKKAEKQIIKLSSAVEQSANTIIITDINGNIEYTNRKFTELTGYTSEEVLGQNPRILSSGRQTKEYYNEMWQTIIAGKNWTGEFNNKKKNGDYFWEYVTVSPIRNEEGGITNFLAIKEDITALKENQQQLKRQNKELLKAKEKAEESETRFKVLHNASFGGIAIHKKGIILDCNLGLSEISGYTVEELINMDGLLLIAEKSRDRVMGNILAGYEASYEVVGIRKNGEKYPVRLEARVIPYKGENVRVVEFRDITEQKKTEYEFIKAKEKAEESDMLKSAFLANMSHEIRTPMNGILGFSELLKETNITDNDRQDYFKIIKKSSARMLNIINEIMDISKIESGLMEVNIREISLNEQIEQVYYLLKADAEDKGLNLSFKNGLPANETFIKTDSQKLYSILSNLVKNAIKYTDKGSVEFGYNTKANHLEFYVKDTGIGIPADRQEAIFERFIQSDIADIEARQGAGLGLSIAKAFVEMLGGKIWVVSEIGKGTIFYFTLPSSVKKEVKSVINDVSSEIKAYNQVKNLKILIVEDDAVSEMLLSIYVKEFCNEVLKARSGSEAIEICRNNPDIDLILMDIQMSDLNGYEATRQIRQFNEDVIIIAQTAFGLSGDRKKAIVSGCNDYISKPIRKVKLIPLIQKYFKNN
ncbi:MAG: PAS domain S-box protein [Bacteroidetes bacterium]|nr:PAS domain S-box protein [Bacteroidota bacterium]